VRTRGTRPIAVGRMSEATVDPNQWRQSSRSIYLHLACSSSYTITSSPLHMIPPQAMKTSRRQPIPVMGTTEMRRTMNAAKQQDVDDRRCINQLKKETSHASVLIRRRNFTH